MRLGSEKRHLKKTERKVSRREDIRVEYSFAKVILAEAEPGHKDSLLLKPWVSLLTPRD